MPSGLVDSISRVPIIWVGYIVVKKMKTTGRTYILDGLMSLWLSLYRAVIELRSDLWKSG